MRILKIILCGIWMLFAIPSLAQDAGAPSINNLNDIRVDELTDDQVRTFIQRVEESGLTQQQLELLAKQRGMSSTEIAKLRTRILKVRSQSDPQSPPNQSGTVNRLREDPMANEEEQDQFAFFEYLTLADSIQEEELEIFGLSIFRNANVSFQPSMNIPTPKNYMLGPGDEIIIDVFGASERTYQQVISPSGSILISGLGPIRLSGLTIEQADTRIKNKLSSIYSGIKGQPGNPANTYVEVSLGQLRSIKVIIIGEVIQPGAYQIQSFSNIFNALYYAGGPSESGSFRNIQVLREGKLIEQVDLYDALISGKINQSFTLSDQDVILVKPYQNRVTLSGAVKRPAIYELLPNETLADLLSYAGGFAENAFSEIINVERQGPLRKEVKTVKKESFNDFEIKNGDIIDIGKIQNRFTNRVIIQGAVNRPSQYEYTQGLKFTDIIALAGGLREDAFMGRAVILRQEQDLTLTSISLHVADVMEGRSSDIQLQPEDLVKVSSIFDLRENYILKIEGEVINPGEYSYVDNLTVEDLITLAGGLKESASKSSIEVARRITTEETNFNAISEIFNFTINKDLTLNEDASDFKLNPFDLVIVRKSAGYENQVMVEIEGEVAYPGKYALEKREEKISDVIDRAGGLTPYAYEKGATLIRRTEYYKSPEQKAEEAENDRFQNQRLNADSNEETNAASQLRKNALLALEQRDSLLLEVDIKEQESIGIELEEILNKPGNKYDLILQEGDIISIPKQLQTVRLQGELLYPSTVRYDNKIGFKEYISMAGGYTEDARVGKAYIVYANGSAARTKKFLWIKNYPPVEPGAEIIIPKRPERRKLSPGEIVSIASGLGTIALIINNLTNR